MHAPRTVHVFGACLLALVSVAGCTGSITNSGGQRGNGPGDAGPDSSEPVAPGRPDANDTASWWKPSPGTSWQWQLSGSISTNIDVEMYDIDLFQSSQSTIDKLHADGRVVVCYFSAGSIEDWRVDASDFPPAAIGEELDGWEGENWIDIRSAGVRDVMKARLDLARQKGCDGVEPDNVDGYANQSGFGLTPSEQLDFNRFLADEAHVRELSIGLKNDVDQIPQLVGDFDWALNEECFEYRECDTYDPFIEAGKAVFQVEYGDSATASDICDDANGMNIDSLVKNLDLDAYRIACR